VAFTAWVAEPLIAAQSARKAAGAFSTLEAGVEALQFIEPGTDFAPFSRPFEALIETGQI